MNFAFDFQMLYLGIGLLGFVCLNILLGSVDGLLQKQFDKVKFLNGVIKGAVVSFSFVAVYFIGCLLPEIAINIDGQELTILMAVKLILTGGVVYYAKEVIVGKLIPFVGAKFNA